MVAMPGPVRIQKIVSLLSNPNVVFAQTNGYVVYRNDDAGLIWRLRVKGREEVLNVRP